MIGDQLMTDVFGANRMGINSIFVNPISKIEHLPTHVNRYFESKIIKRLNKRGILIKGEYYE
jgi:predicted HAD superfamily phosphohydrolase YqeG